MLGLTRAPRSEKWKKGLGWALWTAELMESRTEQPKD